MEVELILEPGSYIVVPRTTGCGLRRPEGAETESIKPIDGSGNFNSMFASAIEDIFKKFDLVVSHTIDFKEWKGFLEIIGKSSGNEADFKTNILGKFTSFEDGLTMRGFKEWWRQ